MSHETIVPNSESHRVNPSCLLEFPALVPRSFVLSDVPALPATVIMLELLLDQPTVDLAAVSEVVLSDLGATLQILRTRSENWDQDEEQSCRVPARLVALGKDVILEAITPFAVVGPDFPVGADFELWEHSRLVAECARAIAPGFQGVDPEKAYLAGLLHEIGRLPEVLGDCDRPRGESEVAVAEYLIREWALPRCVTGTLTPRAESASDTAEITKVVAIAHELVRLEHNPRPA
jgi:HDOD domain